MITAQNSLLQTSCQKGFTLLESLLVIMLFALLVTGVYEMYDNWMQRAINYKAAEQMLRVQNASQEYAFVNFDTFKTAPLGQFIEIDIDDLKTFNYLPSSYDAINVFKQSIRAFRRTSRQASLDSVTGVPITDGIGNIVYIYNIEVVTVSDNPTYGTVRVPLERLVSTAQQGGPKMGIIATNVLGSTTTTGRVTSLFSQWWFPLADLSAVGYLATPDATDGGYLAAYARVSSGDTEPNDQLLYRVEINGRPELNRMATDLRMGNNRIENVGSLVADKVSVTGNAAFLGLAQGGSSEGAQAMTVDQAMLVNGTYVPGNTATENRINMKATGAGCGISTDAGTGNRSITGAGCTASGGEIQVVSGSTSSLDATMDLNTLTTDGSAITDITQISGDTETRGVSTFNTFNTNDLTATKQLIAPTSNVSGGTVDTQQMQAADMTVTTGAVVNDSLIAASLKPGVGKGVTTRDLAIANTATFTNSVRVGDASTGTGGITATKSTYVKNVATGNYNDAKLGRNMTCTVSGGYTYCEPVGTVHTWPNGDIESCNSNGNGYTCSFRDSLGADRGSCVYTRAVNGSTHQAYHSVSCL